MGEIKAIETKYNGYRFRSRLEARWAVFFDAMGIKYEYEPEGFELGNGCRYLPDFYFPDNDVWVEIKGKQLSENERRKIELFCQAKCNLPVNGTRFRLLEGEVPKKPVVIGDVPGISSFIYVHPDELAKAVKHFSGKEPPKPEMGVLMGGLWVQDNPDRWNYNSLACALSIARKARFEHGETPTVEEIKKKMEAI